MIVSSNSILQHVFQNKNGIINHVNENVKIIISVIKDYCWNPSIFTCENSKYLKSVADTSVIECNKF